MIYLATVSGPGPRQAIADGHLGQMITPNTGNKLVDGATWALDNGCFTATWCPRRWAATLDRHQHQPGCLFAVAPDVVGDAEATHDMWARWWPAAMRRGYRTAYVAQNGIRFLPAGIQAVFIGGDDTFKLGPEGRKVIAAAHRLGLWIHMGRVNSYRRLRYAADLGVHSVDGTYLAYGPSQNLPTLLGWLNAINGHPDQLRLPLEQAA